MAKSTPATSIDDSEKGLIASAAEKLRAGKNPNRREAAALRRHQKAKDQEVVDAAYAAVPKKRWREWSGRQHKVLDEQAARYGIPLGKTIDLGKLARWLHDFLAENSLRLAAGDDDDRFAGMTSPALERKRLADAKLAELKLRRELDDWLPRHKVHEGLLELAGVIRQAADTLQKQYGHEAFTILTEAIEDGQARVMTALSTDDEDDGHRDDDP